MNQIFRPRVVLVTAVLTVAAVVLGAASAGAHVTVNPREATAGGYAKLAFRAPNERDNSDTVKLEIAFPADHPFASVSVRPKDGWTYTVSKRNLETPVEAHGEQVTTAVDRITWTGGAIRPGEFDEFEVSLGPLPEDADSLVFKALQTYGDGEVVRWIEEPTSDGAEPERPAPVLRLTKADAATAATPPSAAGESEEAGESSQGGEVAGDDVASESDVDTARIFGILGMVFGLLGLGAALAAWRRGGAAGAAGSDQ